MSVVQINYTDAVLGTKTANAGSDGSLTTSTGSSVLIGVAGFGQAGNIPFGGAGNSVGVSLPIGYSLLTPWAGVTEGPGVEY